VDIPLEQFFTTYMIDDTKIWTMKVKFLYIPKYLVIDFLFIHEIDKMGKIENSKTQSHNIDKKTKYFL
jgi:hypothetical protein